MLVKMPQRDYSTSKTCKKTDSLTKVRFFFPSTVSDTVCHILIIIFLVAFWVKRIMMCDMGHDV